MTDDHPHRESDRGINERKRPREGEKYPREEQFSESRPAPNPNDDSENQNLDPGATDVLLARPRTDPKHKDSKNHPAKARLVALRRQGGELPPLFVNEIADNDRDQKAIGVIRGGLARCCPHRPQDTSQRQIRRGLSRIERKNKQQNCKKDRNRQQRKQPPMQRSLICV